MNTAFWYVKQAVEVFWIVFVITECLQEKEFNLIRLNKYSNCGIHHKYLKLLFLFK